MRVPSLVSSSSLSLLALLALAVAASAQDPDGEPGCAQSNPCEVILEVDDGGIADLDPSVFGTGDWILFSIYNADDETHTLRLEGHDFEASVAGGDIIDTQPFRLGEPGTYDLRDLPTGDTADITVEDEEVFGAETGAANDDEGDADGGSNPMPGPGPVILLALLGLVAWGLRRK